MTECIDSSVVVKWFKTGEESEKEAQRLYQKITDMEINAVANEWILLETTRGLVKVGYPKKKIDDAFDILSELFTIGAIKQIRVAPIISLAKNLEIGYKLYAADALHLATAIITNSKILWTDDDHLHKRGIREYAKGYGVNILRLSELG